MLDQVIFNYRKNIDQNHVNGNTNTFIIMFIVPEIKQELEPCKHSQNIR